jgi:hypothetical protein
LITPDLQTGKISKPIEDTLGNNTVIDTLVHKEKAQVRLLLNAGFMLVYSWEFNAWAKWVTGYEKTLGIAHLERTPVYLCNRCIAGHCGFLTKEDDIIKRFWQLSYYSAIPLLTIKSPWVKLANLAGFQRVYEVQVIGEYVGSHNLLVKPYIDYIEGDVHETVFDVHEAKEPYILKLKPQVQKCNAMMVQIKDICYDEANYDSAKFTAVEITVGLKNIISKKTKRG